MLFIPFPFSDTLSKLSKPHQRSHTQKIPNEGISVVEFPHHLVSRKSRCQRRKLDPSVNQLSVYLSSLLSLLMATLLGFLDDIFDIRWRHKLPVPIIASIPLLMVYYAEHGNTHVVVPLPFRPILGTLVNLGRYNWFPLISCRLICDRASLLFVHDATFYLFDQQHQHPCGN